MTDNFEDVPLVVDSTRDSIAQLLADRVIGQYKLPMTLDIETSPMSVTTDGQTIWMPPGYGNSHAVSEYVCTFNANDPEGWAAYMRHESDRVFIDGPTPAGERRVNRSTIAKRRERNRQARRSRARNR